MRRAGLAVDLRVVGTPAELAPGLEFNAYRIVQEALTNVLKHAAAASATVVIGYEPGTLVSTSPMTAAATAATAPAAMV